MAEIASWGDVTFKVNSDEVFSFGGMKRTYSGRWASHNIVGKRPISEFQGASLDELTIEITLDAEFGVKPRAAMSTFRTAAKNGSAAYFYVGGKKVSVNKYVIKNGTENWNEIWNQGELIRASAQITFQEYVESAGGASKKSKKTAKTSKKSKNKANKKKKSTKKSTAKKTYKKGDTVTFHGGTHYVASDSSKGYKATAGAATIFKVASGAKHPYSLIHTKGSKSNVYGWVDKGTFD